MVLGGQLGKVGQKSIFSENFFSTKFDFFKLNMDAKGRIEGAALLFYSSKMKIDYSRYQKLFKIRPKA
jgi:hypothetical protein